MSFAVRLSTDHVAVEAGANAPLAVEVSNRGEELDRYEMEVEGLDPEWTAVPVPTFSVSASDTATERIFFRAPRASESLAGNYPFVVRLRSLNSGEVRSAQGVLQIAAYHHISVEVSPKKGNVGPFHRSEQMSLTLVNLGNTEHTLQLFGSDPEEALAFEFEHDQVTLSPGQQRDVMLTVSPVNTPFISAGRLHGFLVTARSTEQPAVAGATQAQLEERAFLSPATLLFLALAAIVMGFWYFNRPQPPTLDLSVSKTQAQTGEPIEIWWRAAHADRVTIEVDGQIVADGPRDSGTVVITPKEGGRVRISGVARRQDKASETREAAIVVTEPAPAPLPEISEFSISNTSPRVGQTVTVTYRFSGEVSKAFLQPIGELNLNAEQIQVPINEPGKMTLTLIAENREGKTAKKALTLTGKEESLANVVVFKVTPERAPYPGGLVKIVWQLSDAARAEITPHPTSPDNPVVNAQQGDMDVYVDKETVFKLTAWDSKSRQIVKTIKVTVEPPPATAPDEPTTTNSGPAVGDRR